MMFFARLVSWGFLAVCALFAVATQGADVSKRALIVAKPGSVSLIRAQSGPANDDAIQVGDLYSATLRSVRVIKGSVHLPATLKVELIASHREAISAQREIYVLVEMQDNGTPRVIYWDALQKVACLPEQLIEATGFASGFGGFTRYDGSRCTAVD